MAELSGNINQGTVYEVVSSIPGRVRLRVPLLFKNSTDHNKIKEAIAVLDGVTGIRLNPLADSIIITFKEGKISATQLAQAIVIFYLSVVNPQTSESQLRDSSHVVSQNQFSQEDNNNKEKLTLDYTLNDKALTPKLTQSEEKVNLWAKRCQEQAELIEKLQDRLADLKPVATVGSAWLRRWYRYSPSTINPEDIIGMPSLLLTPPDNDTQWPAYAAQQAQAITDLEQCLIDWQRLATIGEARLNKYHKYL